MHRVSARLALTAVFVASAVQLGAQNIPPDFVIRLERTGGGGPSPQYSVAIDATGEVAYHGKAFVRVEGEARDRITLAQVGELLATIDRIGLFNLDELYRYVRRPDGFQVTQTERQTVFVTVTRDGRTKRVEDYFGAPHGLRELESQVDKAAGTQRWIRIDVATLQRMVEAGRAPSLEELGRLLRRALYADEVDVIHALLHLGADPNALPTDEHDGTTLPLFRVRSGAAARNLIHAGANPMAVSDFGETPMWNAVRAAPDVTKVLLEAGVPVDAPIDRDGGTALGHAAHVGNASAVRLLLAAGANPLTRLYGKSALDLAIDARRREANALVPLNSLFVKDFDGVIALLAAAAKQRAR